MEISEGPAAVRPTTLIICVNRRMRADQPSCAARGAESLADDLERSVVERRLDVTVERTKCLGHCRRGPNLRVAPGGAFFSGVGRGDLPAILDRLETDCGRDSRSESLADPPASGA